jgi:hypothetical protein
VPPRSEGHLSFAVQAHVLFAPHRICGNGSDCIRNMPVAAGSLLPYHTAVDEVHPSRPIVALLSWFGLLIGVLHLVGGRTLGAVEALVSLVGVYATWSDVGSRGWYVALFAACWGVQSVIQVLYFALLLAAMSVSATAFVADVIASSTFANLSPSLRSLLETLGGDVGGFVIFSDFISCVFASLACTFGVSLWKEVASLRSTPERAPLLRRPPAPRPSTGGFGSLGHTPPAERPARPKATPFQGKGNRLGAE